MSELSWLFGGPRESDLGYLIKREDVRGRALLCGKSCASDLVKRLKDKPTADRSEETRFWGGLLARLANDTGLAWSCVTCPPGSGKRSWSLAADLAHVVAEEIGLPFRACYVNENPRGNRIGGIARKLSDPTTYTYCGPCDGSSILLIDDYYCTGQTVRRCAAVASPDAVTLIALGMS